MLKTEFVTKFQRKNPFLKIIIIIIMQRLMRHVSVIRMTNCRKGGHVDLRVAVSVIKRFEFLFESICSDVQVASDDVR